MTRLQVLSVVSEAYPLIKTGGLADVAGALPAALRPEGIDMVTLIPGYAEVMGALKRPRLVGEIGDLFGGPARLVRGRARGLDVIGVDAPHLYRRPGGPYADPSGREFPDNWARFAALGLAAAQIGAGAVGEMRPLVVHAHDWQAALAPAYLHYRRTPGPRPASVMTVHNLAFQGQFDRRVFRALGLPPRAFAPDGVEYYGDVGFLKAGLQFADKITTVSPTYAAEICGPEAGMGLDGLLRWRADDLVGVLNGVDTQVWDPASDPRIPATYDADTLEPRRLNTRALRAQFGLSEAPGAPLFGVVSRLSWQKGLDLLAAAASILLAGGGQLAVLGSGDPELVGVLGELAAAHPGRVACRFDYDEDLAHLMQAGCDVIVVPSRFEPCGLTQLCALRYGALPLVARVGGLADTVIDANPAALAAGAATGVQFPPNAAGGLEAAIRRTLTLWSQPDIWRRMQRNGMESDVSWAGPARAYASLYRALAARPVS